MSKVKLVVLVIICVLVVLIPVYFFATPAGKARWNNWFYSVQKADDNTNYQTMMKVEFTCRGMITSYTSDKVRYEQFKNAKSEDLREIAEQAKMRANATASAYNNYVLKNSYVWGDNVPSDIKTELQYIE